MTAFPPVLIVIRKNFPSAVNSHVRINSTRIYNNIMYILVQEDLIVRQLHQLFDLVNEGKLKCGSVSLNP